MCVSKPGQREFIQSLGTELAGHPILTRVKKLLLALPVPLLQPFPIFHSCSSPWHPSSRASPSPRKG